MVEKGKLKKLGLIIYLKGIIEVIIMEQKMEKYRIN
tara:strand:+ start:302 stop:409 length:108 start_codon:yes stop_codon:yes gene_type:complete